MKLNATATASFRLFQKPRKKNSAAHWRMPDGAVFSGMALGNSFDGLRALRREADITQAELADAIGVRQSTISDWEHGSPARVEFTTIDTLCSVLGRSLRRKVSLDDLRRKPK